MTQEERILEIAHAGGGIISACQVSEAGLGNWALRSLVRKGLLSSVQRGIYVTADGYVDDFFLLQQKYRTGVFSHETALYLHGLSDRASTRYIMTFPVGTSTTRMKADAVHSVVTSVEFELGVMQMKRGKSQIINVYDVERTLVDLLKPKYEADLEQLMPALRRYAARPDKDINKLYGYAKLFGVETKIRNYMEVLL